MKKLMIKFHGGIRLTDAEIAAIDDYLFDDGIFPPLTDEGVRKTVRYLWNLCVRNDLRTLELLLGYYEKLRTTAEQAFDELHKRQNN